MPTSKEFAIRLEDRPGTLAQVCRTLADRGVNILAFQAFPSEGKSQVCIVVDNPKTARSVLDSEGLTYTEDEVAQVKLPHRAGELARVASRLGEANINIDHAHCGVEPGTNASLLIFGVADVAKAAAILDQIVTAAREARAYTAAGRPCAGGGGPPPRLRQSATSIHPGKFAGLCYSCRSLNLKASLHGTARIG